MYKLLLINILTINIINLCSNLTLNAIDYDHIAKPIPHRLSAAPIIPTSSVHRINSATQTSPSPDSARNNFTSGAGRASPFFMIATPSPEPIARAAAPGPETLRPAGPTATALLTMLAQSHVPSASPAPAITAFTRAGTSPAPRPFTGSPGHPGSGTISPDLNPRSNRPTMSEIVVTIALVIVVNNCLQRCVAKF